MEAGLILNNALIRTENTPSIYAVSEISDFNLSQLVLFEKGFS